MVFYVFSLIVFKGKKNLFVFLYLRVRGGCSELRYWELGVRRRVVFLVGGWIEMNLVFRFRYSINSYSN